MKRGLIVTGGELNMAFARSFLEGNEFHKIIAVDGGLKAVDALDLTPDYVVGDLDSVESVLVEQYRALPFIVWEVHKPEKDETDTELARNRAVALGCDEIVFLGATGGRMDHFLSNIHMLYDCMQRGINARIVDQQNVLYLLDKGKRFYREKLAGKYISFLPYTEEVKGVTLKGFRYPLAEKDICLGVEAGRCISNELSEQIGTLTFTDGVLICVESSDRA